MKKKRIDKAALFAFFLLTISMLLPGCGENTNEHKHTWIPQTCTDPLICTTCGATKGEPYGHKWLDATCSAPATCGVCGATEGDTLPHTWREATHQTLKTCEVCGVTEGDYKYVTYTELASASEMVIASKNCIIARDGVHYGVMNTNGEMLTDYKYDGYLAFMQDDCFALCVNKEECNEWELYSYDGEVIWSNTLGYSEYDIVGAAGGYLTLKNWEDNTWYYLDMNNDFTSSLYIDADSLYKEKLSLANKGFITSKNVGSIGYPYLDIEKKAFIKGEYEDDSFVDSRGCAVNDNSEMLASIWSIRNDGYYSLEGCGFLNLSTNEFTKIEDWYDDNYLVRHIYYFNGSGINEYDCVGDYMLMQTDVLKVEEKELPVYNLYNYKTGEFITDYGLEGIYLGTNANIGAVYDEKGNVKYSYLDSSCNLLGKLYDDATYFADDYAMVVLGNNGYFINADMGIVSLPMEAEAAVHRFDKIFVVSYEGTDKLIRLEE